MKRIESTSVFSFFYFHYFHFLCILVDVTVVVVFEHLLKYVPQPFLIKRGKDIKQQHLTELMCKWQK